MSKCYERPVYDVCTIFRFYCRFNLYSLRGFQGRCQYDLVVSHRLFDGFFWHGFGYIDILFIIHVNLWSVFFAGLPPFEKGFCFCPASNMCDCFLRKKRKAPGFPMLFLYCYASYVHSSQSLITVLPSRIRKSFHDPLFDSDHVLSARYIACSML